MEIRKVRQSDLEGVKKLLSQVLELHAKLRPDIFIPGTRKYTDDELREIFEDPERPIFIAADDQDQVLGYCFCQLQERKGVVNMTDMKTLYIDDLCVDEASRGQHVGRTLYEYVTDFARSEGCKNITLNVWEGNDKARAFYDSMGFGVQKTMMEKKL